MRRSTAESLNPHELRHAFIHTMLKSYGTKFQPDALFIVRTLGMLEALVHYVGFVQSDSRPWCSTVGSVVAVEVLTSVLPVVTAEPLTELLKYLPGKVAQCRIFAMSHEQDNALATALERALSEEPASIVTNV